MRVVVLLFVCFFLSFFSFFLSFLFRFRRDGCFEWLTLRFRSWHFQNRHASGSIQMRAHVYILRRVKETATAQAETNTPTLFSQLKDILMFTVQLHLRTSAVKTMTLSACRAHALGWEIAGFHTDSFASRHFSSSTTFTTFNGTKHIYVYICTYIYIHIYIRWDSMNSLYYTCKKTSIVDFYQWWKIMYSGWF